MLLLKVLFALSKAFDRSLLEINWLSPRFRWHSTSKTSNVGSLFQSSNQTEALALLHRQCWLRVQTNKCQLDNSQSWHCWRFTFYWGHWKSSSVFFMKHEITPLDSSHISVASTVDPSLFIMWVCPAYNAYLCVYMCPTYINTDSTALTLQACNYLMFSILIWAHLKLSSLFISSSKHF